MYGVDYKAHDGYVGTGAGLTLSAHNFHGALINALANVSCHKGATHNDDVVIASCLRLVGVRVGDSRDEHGRFRFWPSTLDLITDNDEAVAAAVVILKCAGCSELRARLRLVQR
ncbi:unnamed protein product [Sphagnum balticum]